MDAFSAQSAFALSLYNTFALADEGKNFLMSPLAIFAALSLVLPGAREETLRQMLRAMRLDASAPMESTEEALGKMLAAAAGTGGSAIHLLLANRAYIEASCAVRQEYLAALRKHFAAEIVTAKFGADPIEECRRINDWVAELTKGKIVDLLTPDSLTVDTRLVLVNALYLRANWSLPFNPRKTHLERFETTEDAPPVSVQMMRQRAEFPVVKIPNLLTGVRLDFKADAGEQMSLFAILPERRHRLDALMSSLGQDGWLRVLNAQAEVLDAQISLPRVRLSGMAELSGAKYLPSLGVKDLFDGDRANLSGIASIPPNLFARRFAHKAALALDEFGAEGAAADAVSILEKSKPTVVKFDQPFALIVVKTVSGVGNAAAPQLVPIFMGRVSDPTQS